MHFRLSLCRCVSTMDDSALKPPRSRSANPPSSMSEEVQIAPPSYSEVLEMYKPYIHPSLVDQMKTVGEQSRELTNIHREPDSSGGGGPAPVGANVGAGGASVYPWASAWNTISLGQEWAELIPAGEFFYPPPYLK